MSHIRAILALCLLCCVAQSSDKICDNAWCNSYEIGLGYLYQSHKSAELDITSHAPLLHLNMTRSSWDRAYKFSADANIAYLFADIHHNGAVVANDKERFGTNGAYILAQGNVAKNWLDSSTNALFSTLSIGFKNSIYNEASGVPSPFVLYLGIGLDG